MSRDPNQVFVIAALTREGIMESLQYVLECSEGDLKHPTGPQDLLKDDDRLTDEICQEYARALGDIDPLDSEETVSEAEHNAAIFALKAMGYVEEELTPAEKERKEILEWFSAYEKQLVKHRARLQELACTIARTR